jgi:DNA-3-methyladenine glycosylase I
MTEKTRCNWANGDPLLAEYHDAEWGTPLHDDQKLFELLCLEGAQAGLSWLTVLKKRANYRRVFDDFDARRIAAYDDAKRAELLNDAGIIRNRLKVNAFIENAKAFLRVQQEFGSFDTYIWQFAPAHFDSSEDPIVLAKPFSKDSQKRGFRFVGPTTCFAFMQAAGLVNDHAQDCFRFKELAPA